MGYMIKLKTIVKHSAEVGYIALENGGKEKVQKGSLLFCVEVFLADIITYILYCLNQLSLESPLRTFFFIVGLYGQNICFFSCMYL